MTSWDSPSSVEPEPIQRTASQGYVLGVSR